MAGKRTETFAPIPARAGIDDRLAARHWRTLAVIAMHDRFGANGIGCYASHERLKELIGCDYSRLSTNIKDLGEWGYLERITHPLNKRLRVYRIIYTADDKAVMGRASKSDDSLPDGKEPPSDSLPNGKQFDPDSLPKKIHEPTDSKGLRGVNIFRETEKISGRNLKRYSPEGASSGEDAKSAKEKGDEGLDIGARLAMLQRSIMAGHAFENIDETRQFLDMVMEDIDLPNNLRGWAYRLCDELAALEGDLEAMEGI